MKKVIKILCCVLTPIIIMCILAYAKVKDIPNTVFVRQGENVLKTSLFEFDRYKEVSSVGESKIKKVDISILGILPVKSVSVKSVPRIKLYVGGQPIGIKLNTKGVLIVGFSDINTSNGKIPSPAAAEGVQIGDSILKVNGENILDIQDLGNKINKAKDNKISLTLERKGKDTTKVITKVKSEDNNYKIGLWVRDSTAGVGTLTFYYSKTNQFGALGHPITDVDTGTMLKVNSGNLLNSSIVSIRKGFKGTPGEIRGIFVNEDNPIGSVQKNTMCGIFGKGADNAFNNKLNKQMEIGLRNEIKTGEAKILTTIDGDEPRLYSVYIEKLYPQESPGPKSMLIRVTDPELLKKTGGIVQGMSGSPIIQNNKIVGAVTHVLINKPDVGYGIYIEWMLKDAGIF